MMKMRLSPPFAVFVVSFALVAGPLWPAAHTTSAVATPAALPVVFVPGISGSMLVDDQNVEYWPAIGALSHAGLTLYPSQSHPSLHASYAVTQVVVGGIHISSYDSETYGPLLTYLGNNGFVQYESGGDPAKRTTAGCDLSQAASQPNLFVFPYDWRQSSAENAIALKDYIGCVQRFYPNTQINLIAHSMGGLVSRRYMLDNPGTHHVNALITVATPWLGAGKLVWVMETGEFVFFVWDSTLLKVIGSFTGAHELMNSQAWYDLGGTPAIIEDGQDLNKNGIDTEQYTYAELAAYMDKFKGKEGFLPGSANKQFHAFSSSQGQQDDWANDTTGAKYFHIVGAGGAPDTISQVVATTFVKCLYYGSTDCDWSTWEYPIYDIGDQTVPLLSSSRIGGANGNYNAPGATVYVCKSTGANNDNVSHTAMLSNSVVQGLLLQYLAEANGATPTPPPDSLTCGTGGSSTPATDMYHRLVVEGGSNVRVSDVTTPTNTLPFLSGVTQHALGPAATQLIMPSGDYTVTFTTAQTGTTFIEWLFGSGAQITSAVRFIDARLPPNRNAAIVLNAGAFGALRYDGDGDGELDSTLQPTVDAQGLPARDIDPPVVTVTSNLSTDSARVTINSQDNGVGVERVLYSLDGKHFHPYSRPFTVDPRQVRVVYAFADDKIGNRTSLRTYQLPKLNFYLPFMPNLH